MSQPPRLRLTYMQSYGGPIPLGALRASVTHDKISADVDPCFRYQCVLISELYHDSVLWSRGIVHTVPVQPENTTLPLQLLFHFSFSNSDYIYYVKKMIVNGALFIWIYAPRPLCHPHHCSISPSASSMWQDQVPHPSCLFCPQQLGLYRKYITSKPCSLNA